MLQKIKKIINLLANPKFVRQLLSMGSSGYLYETGWIQAFNEQLPIDKVGNPLPWVTYSFIDFIFCRLNKQMNIFEYGSGNSTLWYAKHVNSVVSVEHDKLWFEKIKNTMPTNVNIYYEKLIYGKKYSTFSKNIGRKFDIVIVDGRDRVNCLKSAVSSITNNGVIILDDSERENYKEGIDFLMQNGFKKIDFWGISPGLFYKKCTTVFYKNNNCLGI
jgi:hypothetical protein